MQFWSILSTFRGTFGALLVWIQRSHLLSKGLRCQGGRTEFRKGSPSWQPCPKKDVNYMLLLLQRWGSKPVIVLTGFFGWRSSCTTAMMYQVLTPKNAQEMPLAIVAWHWRVASRWSGDDPGAGKLVATDWIGTHLLWGYWHLKKLEHVLTKKTLHLRSTCSCHRLKTKRTQENPVGTWMIFLPIWALLGSKFDSAGALWPIQHHLSKGWTYQDQPGLIGSTWVTLCYTVVIPVLNPNPYTFILDNCIHIILYT